MSAYREVRPTPMRDAATGIECASGSDTSPPGGFGCGTDTIRHRSGNVLRMTSKRTYGESSPRRDLTDALEVATQSAGVERTYFDRLRGALGESDRRRASGEPHRRTTYEKGAGYLSIRKPGHEPIAIHPGSVEFVGQGDYDVTVTVGLDRTSSEAPVAAVTELAARYRPGGRPIGSRGVHDLNVGALVAEAVEALTRADDGKFIPTRVVGAGSELRRAMVAAPKRRPGRQPIPDDELRFLAEQWQAAKPRERLATVSAAFAASRYGRVQDEALRKRVKLARDRTDPTTGEKFLLPAR